LTQNKSARAESAACSSLHFPIAACSISVNPASANCRPVTARVTPIKGNTSGKSALITSNDRAFMSTEAVEIHSLICSSETCSTPRHVCCLTPSLSCRARFCDDVKNNCCILLIGRLVYNLLFVGYRPPVLQARPSRHVGYQVINGLNPFLAPGSFL